MPSTVPWKMSPDKFTEQYGVGFKGAEALKTLGGVAVMAGIDPEILTTARRIVDHPMLGRRARVYIQFPGEEPVGMAEGKVDRVLTHPRGLLLFDLVIDKPDVYVTERLWPRELHAGIVALALDRGKDVPPKAKRGYTKRMGRWAPLPEIKRELLGF